MLEQLRGLDPSIMRKMKVLFIYDSDYEAVSQLLPSGTWIDLPSSEGSYILMVTEEWEVFDDQIKDVCKRPIIYCDRVLKVDP